MRNKSRRHENSHKGTKKNKARSTNIEIRNKFKIAKRKSSKFKKKQARETHERRERFVCNLWFVVCDLFFGFWSFGFWSFEFVSSFGFRIY
ncbi:MAG: hypothetical protein NT166_31555 [Candidatus Aminicenantes bacterium]|nr:hypothetical protein [Candidatus Aminicenantes bacterium]